MKSMAVTTVLLLCLLPGLACVGNRQEVIHTLKAPDNMKEVQVIVTYRRAFDAGDYNVFIKSEKHGRKVRLFGFQGAYLRDPSTSLQISWRNESTLLIRPGKAFIYDFSNQAEDPSDSSDYIRLVLIEEAR